MRFCTINVLFLLLSSVGVAMESLVGIFAPQKLGSRLELTDDGKFSLQMVDEPRFWFLSGHWKENGNVLVLSWGDEIARYTVEESGRRLVLIRKEKAALLVEHIDVALASEYKKEAIKPVQRTVAGARR